MSGPAPAGAPGGSSGSAPASGSSSSSSSSNKVGELLARAKALAARMPWWGWLLVAVGLYLGYRLIAGGANADTSAGGDQSSGTPGVGDQLGDLTPLTSGLGDLTPLSGGGGGLGDLTDDSGDDGQDGNGGDLDSLAAALQRQAKQAADLREYWKEQDQKREVVNSAQALRSKEQGQDLHALQAQQAAKAQATLAAQQRVSAAQAAARNAAQERQQAAGKPVTNRGQNVALGVGDGPDSATRTGQYQMRRGETISDVASAYGVSTEDLYAANRDRFNVKLREAGWMGLTALEVANLEGLVIAIP